MKKIPRDKKSKKTQGRSYHFISRQLPNKDNKVYHDETRIYNSLTSPLLS